MAVVLSCSAVSKRYGAKPLFENLTMAVHDGQRIGLTGPNGSGKSTLMRIMAATDVPDEGLRTVRKQTIVAYVPQDSVFEPGQTVRSVLETALADLPSVLRNQKRHGPSVARRKARKHKMKAIRKPPRFRKTSRPTARTKCFAIPLPLLLLSLCGFHNRTQVVSEPIRERRIIWSGVWQTEPIWYRFICFPDPVGHSTVNLSP